MTVAVREATPDDADAIDAVRFASWRVAYGELAPAAVFDEWNHAQAVERVRTRIADGSSRGMVAERDGTIVGFCTYGDCRDPDLPEAAEIYAIYADPRHWSTGVGRALFAAAVQALAGRPIVLWVLRDNARAQRFYRIAGMLPDGTAREVTLGVPLPEIRYRLG